MSVTFNVSAIADRLLAQIAIAGFTAYQVATLALGLLWGSVFRY